MQIFYVPCLVHDPPCASVTLLQIKTFTVHMCDVNSMPPFYDCPDISHYLWTIIRDVSFGGINKVCNNLLTTDFCYIYPILKIFEISFTYLLYFVFVSITTVYLYS